MTANQLLKNCRDLRFSTKHRKPWKNSVANDLNIVLGRAEYIMGTDGDEYDCEAAGAMLRTVMRLADSEEIARATAKKANSTP